MHSNWVYLFWNSAISICLTVSPTRYCMASIWWWYQTMNWKGTAKSITIYDRLIVVAHCRRRKNSFRTVHCYQCVNERHGAHIRKVNVKLEIEFRLPLSWDNKIDWNVCDNNALNSNVVLSTDRNQWVAINTTTTETAPLRYVCSVCGYWVIITWGCECLRMAVNEWRSLSFQIKLQLHFATSKPVCSPRFFREFNNFLIQAWLIDVQ